MCYKKHTRINICIIPCNVSRAMFRRKKHLENKFITQIEDGARGRV